MRAVRRRQPRSERLFDECKILFTPGEPQHAPEPGFYRICYAYAPIEGVRAAFERLGRFAARLRAERASAS
jgi:aspartate/methionine/tyrosine aminotransferase